MRSALLATALAVLISPARATASVADVQPCPSPADNAYYFPVNTFLVGKLKDDEFPRRWYSGALRAMNEPSLSCGPADADESYRLLWLRSFDRPMAVRVMRTGDRYQLKATILTGAGGYDPGMIDQTVNRTLTKGQWDQLVAELSNVGFWAMATEAPLDNRIPVDGAQWILEGRDKTYHVVDRWSGEEGVKDVGLLMLTFAGIDLSKERVY